MLYGGIDSKEVTDRAADPSGAMGAIQRILSNDVACKNVARDFARPAEERRLFPGIEPRRDARRLGRGRRDDPQGDRPPARADPGPLRRRGLRRGRADVQAVRRRSSRTRRTQKGLDKQENYSCRPGADARRSPDDPHYTIRAWRGVVTYLLRRPEFLYE